MWGEGWGKPWWANKGADAYVALRLPGGTLLFLQPDGTLTPAILPILRNWPISPFTEQIFAYTFGGTEPVGSYTWRAAFIDPRTSTLIGAIAEAPFTFSP